MHIEKVLAIVINFPLPLEKRISAIQRRYFPKYAANKPHITLYLCKFPSKNFTTVLSKLKATPYTACSIKLGTLTSKHSINGNKFYYTNIEGSSIHQLHKQLINLVNPYRAGLIRSKELARIQQGKYTQSQIVNLNKYGYVEVMSKFKPHITIGDGQTLNRQLEAKLRKDIKALSHTLVIPKIKVGLYDYDNRTNKYSLLKASFISLKR